MLSGNDRHAGPDDAFIEELSQLKRRGASVLVVGSTRLDQRTRTCRRLLGHAAEQSRRRILVSTTGEARDVSRLVSETAPDRLNVITHDMPTRSAAVQQSSATPSVDGVSTSSVDTLADLGITLSSTIETLETVADGLDPSELRVGVDSLVPLLEEYGRERVFKFVHVTNGRVTDARGMIHYHLPVDRDADIVAVLSPLFDVVLELREQNGVSQERWSLKDGTLSSGWVSTT